MRLDLHKPADIHSRLWMLCLLYVLCTGDEPLYTQEVDCVSAPLIAAHARHTVLLAPGESVADCFAAEPDASEHLLFEVSI